MKSSRHIHNVTGLSKIVSWHQLETSLFNTQKAFQLQGPRYLVKSVMSYEVDKEGEGEKRDSLT